MQSLAFLLVLAALPVMQSAAPPDNTMERIETGRARLPNGVQIGYRIRLLPTASFPSLPAAIAAQLQQKRCMIPQTYEARRPENVIHGAFEKRGSEDWAVLCSSDGMTTLYVFFQSHPSDAIPLRRQPDGEWLGAEVADAYGSAWGISVRLPSQIRSTKLRGDGPDHNGIEDSFVEHSSSTHYFRDGGWVTLENGN